MTLRDLQPEAMGALDAAERRAREVVDPALLDAVTARIDWLVGAAPGPSAPEDARTADVVAVVEQALMDVARLDDATVRRAAAHFPDGRYSDLVTAAYIIEARTRLRVAGDRLLRSGG